MKAIIVMYDSLNRHMLQPCGCDWTHTPNFVRLAQRSLTFDTAYAGSFPTIPARRELHTGRYNFLHRGWGPLEAFDNSVFEMLKAKGVHTHLESDGYHYWEDGGCTYHTKYATWNFNRGQEGDPCIGDLSDDVSIPGDNVNARFREPAWIRQDWVNRHHMPDEQDMPQSRTFAGGEAFLRRNHKADNWLLQIETFDPHEPYYCPKKYRDLYPHEYHGPAFDWPPYAPASELSREEAHHLRMGCAALHSMCDANLGKVIDLMDELQLWDDTLLIVNTDHGFLLGEHGWFGKMFIPLYDEIARLPLFIWDPRCRCPGERRSALVQTIDLAATLLDYFGVQCPPEMLGKPLRETCATDAPVREAGLFGRHGGDVCCTDGRYVYVRAPVTFSDAFEFTLMPGYMRGPFGIDVLRTGEAAGPFTFTKGAPIMKYNVGPRKEGCMQEAASLLFDTAEDPRQEKPIRDEALERRMAAHTARLMKENDAPPELLDRMGIHRT